jgi:hypothetical protein
MTVSVSGTSLHWEFSDCERARTRDILHRLEDYRVLYAPYEVAEEAQVFASLGRLRICLTEQVDRCESAELRDQVRALRAGVRQLVTDLEAARRFAARVAQTESTQAHVYLLYSTQGARRAARPGRRGDRGDRRAFRIPIDADLAHSMPPDLESARSRPQAHIRSRHAQDWPLGAWPGTVLPLGGSPGISPAATDCRRREASATAPATVAWTVASPSRSARGLLDECCVIAMPETT